MDRFITFFGVNKIRFFTADREFIGKEWFTYLLEKTIRFRIRIRENMLIANARGMLVPAKTLFRDLRVGEYKILRGKRIPAYAGTEGSTFMSLGFSCQMGNTSSWSPTKILRRLWMTMPKDGESRTAIHNAPIKRIFGSCITL